MNKKKLVEMVHSRDIEMVDLGMTYLLSNYKREYIEKLLILYTYSCLAIGEVVKMYICGDLQYVYTKYNNYYIANYLDGLDIPEMRINYEKEDSGDDI